MQSCCTSDFSYFKDSPNVLQTHPALPVAESDVAGINTERCGGGILVPSLHPSPVRLPGILIGVPFRCRQQ